MNRAILSLFVSMLGERFWDWLDETRSTPTSILRSQHAEFSSQVPAASIRMGTAQALVGAFPGERDATHALVGALSLIEATGGAKRRADDWQGMLIMLTGMPVSKAKAIAERIDAIKPATLSESELSLLEKAGVVSNSEASTARLSGPSRQTVFPLQLKALGEAIAEHYADSAARIGSYRAVLRTMSAVSEGRGDVTQADLADAAALTAYLASRESAAGDVEYEGEIELYDTEVGGIFDFVKKIAANPIVKGALNVGASFLPGPLKDIAQGAISMAAGGGGSASPALPVVSQPSPIAGGIIPGAVTAGLSPAAYGPGRAAPIAADSQELKLPTPMKLQAALSLPAIHVPVTIGQ